MRLIFPWNCNFLSVTFPSINTRYYGDILRGLFPLFGESEPDNAVRDNAAGAVARMIMVHPESIPLNQVLFRCLLMLFSKGNEYHYSLLLIILWACVSLGYVSQVLPVFLKVLPLKEDHEESMAVYSCVCNLVLSSNPQVSISCCCCNFNWLSSCVNSCFVQEVIRFLVLFFALSMQADSVSSSWVG